VLLFNRLTTSVLQSFKPDTAYAHCDIPCGIYDPHQAQIAALTTIRMVQLIEALDSADLSATEKSARLGRYTATKEEHAELCKHELRVLWGDYFRPEHVEAHPQLHELIFGAMKIASRVRQGVDADSAQELLSRTQEIAEIFWQTKGAGTTKQPSLQGAAGGEIVYPTAS
jgi:nickel superoxide dismutase